MRARLAQATVRALFGRSAATLAIQRSSWTKNASVCRTPIHLSEVIVTHQNQDTRTLKRAKRNNKRRGRRNYGAWRRFSLDGTTQYPVRGRLCRYCKHDGSKHLTSSGQPHFYRPATEAEERDPSLMLYRYTLPQGLPAGKAGGSVLVRQMVVANRAELITAFCTACADAMKTHQVLCYQRNVGVGEVVGVQTGHKDLAIAV